MTLLFAELARARNPPDGSGSNTNATPRLAFSLPQHRVPQPTFINSTYTPAKVLYTAAMVAFIRAAFLASAALKTYINPISNFHNVNGTEILCQGQSLVNSYIPQSVVHKYGFDLDNCNLSSGGQLYNHTFDDNDTVHDTGVNIKTDEPMTVKVPAIITTTIVTVCTPPILAPAPYEYAIKSDPIMPWILGNGNFTDKLPDASISSASFTAFLITFLLGWLFGSKHPMPIATFRGHASFLGQVIVKALQTHGRRLLCLLLEQVLLFCIQIYPYVHVGLIIVGLRHGILDLSSELYDHAHSLIITLCGKCIGLGARTEMIVVALRYIVTNFSRNVYDHACSMISTLREKFGGSMRAQLSMLDDLFEAVNVLKAGFSELRNQSEITATTIAIIEASIELQNEAIDKQEVTIHDLQRQIKQLLTRLDCAEDSAFVLKINMDEMQEQCGQQFHELFAGRDSDHQMIAELYESFTQSFDEQTQKQSGLNRHFRLQLNQLEHDLWNARARLDQVEATSKQELKTLTAFFQSDPFQLSKTDRIYAAAVESAPSNQPILLLGPWMAAMCRHVAISSSTHANADKPSSTPSSTPTAPPSLGASSAAAPSQMHRKKMPKARNARPHRRNGASQKGPTGMVSQGPSFDGTTPAAFTFPSLDNVPSENMFGATLPLTFSYRKEPAK